MRLVGGVSLLCALLLGACSTSTSAPVESTRNVTPDPSGSATTTSSTAAPTAATVLASFPDAASVAGWTTVDDTVMGGVSSSSIAWSPDGGGALVFAGRLSTERNGGFSSTLGPVDRTIGGRAAGSRAIGIDATGDGRTYLLQLRAGPTGSDRWIARFTPPAVLPLDTFEPVGQFLRPTTPSTPLDPATITQLGIYVLDGQIGEFRLALRSIDARR